MPAEHGRPLDIAVVGGGVAGLAAAHQLAGRHRVTLYDAAPALGGHARAVAVGGVHLDTAFLIFNERHYPLFMQWLVELGVVSSVVRAEMSACFSDEPKGLHFAFGRGIPAALNHGRNMLRPDFLWMLLEVLRFRRTAARDLIGGRTGVRTLGDYLSDRSRLFRENFVLPLAACIWSLDPDHVFEYPAENILRFFHNHQLLSGRSERAWKTFSGSSRVYVEAFRQKFPGVIRLSCPVRSVRRSEDGVLIGTDEGTTAHDRVVIATHADTALALLSDPTPLELELLGAWTYQENQVLLHTDDAVMHPDRRLWGSWNYRVDAGGPTISYYLNRVQPLETRTDYFLSLTGRGVAEEKVLDRQRLHHPIFTLKSVATQPRLQELNGRRHTYFCGSYFGFGFHEDAVRSSSVVARILGAAGPKDC